MLAKTIQGYTIAEIKESLANIISEKFKPGLALVFASEKILCEELVEVFRSFEIEIFGSGSSEEIAENQLYQDSIVAMLFELNPDYFSVKRFTSEDGLKVGTDIGNWALETFSDPALLLFVAGGGITLNTDQLLQGLFAEGRKIPVFGGLSSAQNFEDRPRFFDVDGISEKGALALVFDNEKIELSGVAVSGWREIGTPKRITRSKGNIVYEIEGIPATDFYEKYFHIRPDQSDEAFNVMEYPISLLREDGGKVIRAAISLQGHDKSVIFGGSIPAGSLVRFCSPSIVETIQHTIEQIQTFKAGTRVENSDALILFDCAIRSRSFGIYMRREIKLIKELWQIPQIGFSSWGEIGNEPGKSCDFHNTVISLVLLRSKENASKDSALKGYSPVQVQNLIESPSRDLSPEELNKEIIQLRKQKNTLSRFLHMTSDDLDQAMSDVQNEKKISEDLLLNILPTPVVARLKSGETNIADDYSEVSILFADLAGFTSFSSDKKAKEVVKILNRLFVNLDILTDKYGAEKIKTIGDSYMAVAGVPQRREDHALVLLRLARGMLNIMHQFNKKFSTQLRLRIGINSGPVIAGVIGKRKFTYDLWGDTVNVASRMESSGVPGRIQVSGTTYEYLKDIYEFENRGMIEIKGKGKMQTWLLL